jgi:hypothetical protein
MEAVEDKDIDEAEEDKGGRVCENAAAVVGVEDGAAIEAVFVGVVTEALLATEVVVIGEEEEKEETEGEVKGDDEEIPELPDKTDGPNEAASKVGDSEDVDILDIPSNVDASISLRSYLVLLHIYKLHTTLSITPIYSILTFI